MVDNSKVIFDDDLVMDVNTGVIGSKSSIKSEGVSFPIDDVISEIDRLESAIDDLESSLDSRTTSNLSENNRNGVYRKAGLLTNVVIGVIIALIVIILIV